MPMKKCSICDLEFTDDRLFCSVCGSKLEEVSEQDNSFGSAVTQDSAISSSGVSVSDATIHPNSVSENVGGTGIPAGSTVDSVPAPNVTAYPGSIPGNVADASSGSAGSGSAVHASSHSALPLVIVSILAFVFLIAAVCFFFMMMDYSRQLDDSWRAEDSLRREAEKVKGELEQAKGELSECQNNLEQVRLELEMAELELGRYDGLRGLYGYGSETYFAEQSVIVLQKGESREAVIYFGLSGTLSMAAESGVTSEWSREWSDNRTRITITGDSAGYSTIRFTNDQNSDSFEILIIVTDR